jgi:serine/threonine-protein kinase RsbW
MTSCIATPLRGPVSMSLPFMPESAGQVRHALVSWLGHHGYDDGVVDDARLVATELVGNAITHACPLRNGTVLVRWRMDSGRLELSVADGGGASSPQVQRAGPDAIGGRGLAIVEALSSTWWVERNNYLHAVHVRMDLDQPAGRGALRRG